MEIKSRAVFISLPFGKLLLGKLLFGKLAKAGYLSLCKAPFYLAKQ
jgi:hypothetical protein